MRIVKFWVFFVAIICAVYMATATELSATNSSQYSPLAPPLPNPSTVNVNVYHQCTGDPLNGMTDPNVPLETYVKRVLPNEWEPYWDAEALDAGAVAVRSWVLSPPPRSNCQYPFGNGVCYYLAYNCGQNYVPGSEQPATNAATDRTRHQFLSYEDSNFPAEAVNTQYRQDTGNPTRSWVNEGSGYPYLRSVAEPVTSNATIGPGASQNGSQRWMSGVNLATGEELSVRWTHYEQILTHYYTGVHLRDGSNANTILTPQYRWVPLWLSRYPSNGQPMSICSGGPNQLTVRLQNTGTLTWTPQTHFDLGVRTPWNGAAAAGVSSPQGLPQEVALGGEVTKTVTIQPPAGTAPGVYTVRLDMAYLPTGTPENPVWFSEREASRPWPTYDLSVQVTGACRFVYMPTILSTGTAGAFFTP